MASTIDVGSDKQLFLDDWFIQEMNGVSLKVNPPVKTGERLMTPDRPWEAARMGAYKTIIDDGGLYRLWYDASSKSGEAELLLCYAYSLDQGRTWIKPNLGLVEFQGSKQNNIVYAPMDQPYSQIHGGTVYKDPNEADDSPRKYKLFYWMDRHEESEERRKATMVPRKKDDEFAPDHTKGPHQWMGFAFSPDGLRWTPWEKNPVMHNFGDTQNVFFWDEQREKYVAYTRVWEPWRMVGRSETDDISSWPNPEPCLGYDEKDPENTDLYNNACIKYPYAKNAYFMFPSVFHREPGERHVNGTLDIQLAVSRDGINWNRPCRRPFIRLGIEKTFDSLSMYASVGLTREGNQLSLYYTGFDNHHGSEPKPYGGIFSRVVMRVDGFMSVDAGYPGGSLTTKPVVFQGDRLELNFDASAGGEVRVEIQNQDGEPIEGFTLDDSIPMTGSSVCYRATWKNDPCLSGLVGKPVRIKFELVDVKLYAFGFQ